SRRLDANPGASEPHDFAVRQQTAFVSRAAASTASRPAFVTCARPSVGTGRPTYITDLGQVASKISEIQKLTAAPLLRDGGDSRFHGLIPDASLSPAHEAIVARRMGGAQRYPSRCRVAMLACPTIV